MDEAVGFSLVAFVKLVEEVFMANDSDELESVIEKTLEHKTLSIVAVPVDYSLATDLIAHI